MFKVLLISTPVGPLGSGLGGGVELTLKNIAQSLLLKGHEVKAVAPAHSLLPGIPLETIEGNCQIPMQTQEQTAWVSFSAQSVLPRMWDYAVSVQENYDVILNFAYDWLPFYLTPFFSTPIAHLVSMGSLNETMDQIIKATHQRFPQALAFHSQAQAETFGLTSVRCIGNALDLSLYEFCPTPKNYMTWIGRISPEKGLEDAIQACYERNLTLRIYGKIQDDNYWNRLKNQWTMAKFEYRGFLSTNDLQSELRNSLGLLMTPHWIEAFGNVVIEALACGVPVIAYRRGGPAEIIQDGVTGFLVEPGSIEGLGNALNRLGEIDRYRCRQQAERDYSLETMGDRLEDWFGELLKQNSPIRPLAN